MQLIQQFDNTFSLCLGASIAWLAMLIQTTLLADVYRTAVGKVGKHFPTCEKTSIDYAVMEKSKEIYTLQPSSAGAT